jgi:4-amino-4-deoxy-L-arabinose transferase-like glycosyltransferase
MEEATRREARAPTDGRRWRLLAWATGPLALEIAFVATVTAVAVALRLWNLGTVPLGLHGDEAWTGLDARRVLDEGWIGPYVPSALGQPTGPLYLTALLFTFMREDTFTLRLSQALLGVATIPFAYLAFRMMHGRAVAGIAAVILTGLMWHLHLSRTAFMVTSWPFMEMVVLSALWPALRARKTWLFLPAGALLGLGVYTYNAYLLFVPAPFVALAWTLARQPDARARIAFVRPILLFAATALLVAMPLVNYVRDNTGLYRSHQEVVGLLDSDRWKDAGWADRAGILWDRGEEWVRGLVEGGRQDFGDGLGAPGVPLVHPLVFVLALAGLAMTLWRFREPASALVIAAVALGSLGALLTIGDGLFRRSEGLAPFLALLAALPLGWLWERAGRRDDALRYAAYAVVMVAATYPGAVAVRDYFGKAQDSLVVRYVFPFELDAASRYMADFPAGTRVYFYSSRWAFDYETRRFLAPGLRGVDRSREFRPSAPPDGALDFSAERPNGVLFVFLDAYLDEVDRAVALYPGGQRAEGKRGAEIIFRAYYLP